MKVLAIGLIVFGAIGLTVNPSGLLFIIPGILLLLKKKKTPSAPAAAPAPAPAPAPASSARVKKPEGIPSRKARKQFTTRVAGVTFPCALDDSYDRSDILEKINDGQIVEIRPYKFRGSDAYYVVDPASGLDIGVLPEDIAALVSSFEDSSVEAYVVECSYFFAGGGDVLDDSKMIYTCKIKGYIL